MSLMILLPVDALDNLGDCSWLGEGNPWALPVLWIRWITMCSCNRTGVWYIYPAQTLLSHQFEYVFNFSKHQMEVFSFEKVLYL